MGLFYWLLQNGVGPSRDVVIPGQVLAMVIAGSIPIFLAALIAHQIARKRGSAWIAVVAGAIVGLVSLIPTPLIQLLLGCWFTGICP